METRNPFGPMTPAQQKEMNRQVMFAVAKFVGIKLVIFVGINLLARKAQKWADSK